ncbi:MAG: Chaperone protein DnaK, partial [Phycisphaerales bacterium]|nr:Chaperone protein DnaK [Phycisphaerales bacterium]
VPPDMRSQVESAINNLRDALKSDDVDRIKKTMAALTTLSHKLTAELYRGAGAAAGAQAGPSAGGPAGDRATAGAGAAAGGDGKKDEDVIDAEFEVK